MSKQLFPQSTNQVLKALIINDLQNDFHPAGMAPVQGSDELVGFANELMKGFELVVATQLWYPADHIIFAANHLWRKPNQVLEKNGFTVELKEMHCVAASFGAELMMGLETSKITKLIKKGTRKDVPSDSSFYDEDGESTGLLEYLKEKGVTEINLMGVKTNESIFKTAMESLRLGIKTNLLLKGLRGIGEEEAIKTMQEEGIIFIP